MLALHMCVRLTFKHKYIYRNKQRQVEITYIHKYNYIFIFGLVYIEEINKYEVHVSLIFDFS